MNKISVGLVAISIISATTANADSGKINFVGSIIDEACVITNNPTNPLTVTLGNVYKGAFTGVGSTAAPTRFVVNLTSCPASVTSAVVKFDGRTDANNTSVLALNSEPGVATNVGIQLHDVNNNIVPLHTNTQSYTLVPGENNLEFLAKYIQTTASPVTAGPANSTAFFTIVYN